MQNLRTVGIFPLIQEAILSAIESAATYINLLTQREEPKKLKINKINCLQNFCGVSFNIKRSIIQTFHVLIYSLFVSLLLFFFLENVLSLDLLLIISI